MRVSNRSSKPYVLLVAFAGLALSVGGCAESPRRLMIGTARPAFGTTEVQVGDIARDFWFTTETGQVTRLSAQRGRVTIVVFPNQANWPDKAFHTQLAELARCTSVYQVGVVVVSIGAPQPPRENALTDLCDSDLPPEHLALVCDPERSLPKLFGSAATGKYFVLTNFFRIAAIGDLNDLETMRNDTRAVVEKIFDQDLREGAFDRLEDELTLW